MNCELCNKDDRGEKVRFEFIPVKHPTEEYGVYLCKDCYSEKYFVMDKSYEIKLYPKKGYTFDFKKEGDENRSWIKTKKNNNGEPISITYYEAIRIERVDEDEDYKNILYDKVEIYFNGLVKSTIKSKTMCMCDLASDVMLTPTNEFFRVKLEWLVKKSKEEIKILKEWKSLSN
jgi:ribosome-binding protein aMBF1 (putative translation factor)